MGAAPRALIAGAGIGGLGAAIALTRAGWDVTVLERAPEPQPLGAGLSVWPNGVAALRALGLGELCEGGAAPRADGALRKADGSEIAGFDPAAIERRFGAPLLAMHRADLLAGLLRGAGPERVRWGAEVSAVEGSGVRLADGTSESADLLVGADGLNSVVRGAQVGAAPARDSGIVAWRGVAALPAATPAGEWWAPRTVAGLLPLSGRRLYWYLAYEGEEGDRAELERRAAVFGDPVPALIAGTAAPDLLCHRLFDRDPCAGWSSDSATLLGDAAHPMLPFLGQGACSALEDAVALGRLVSPGSSDLGAALATYEQHRYARTATLVKGSRRAAAVALAGSGLARAARDLLVGLVPERARMRQLDGIIAPGVHIGESRSSQG